MRQVLSSAVAMLVLGGVAGPSIAQQVLRVNASQVSGSGDGSSWENAFQGVLGLQAALAAAQPGDEIWVAAGTYRPASPGQTSVSFALRSGVAVYGGFGGFEAERAQRDPVLRVTVLSGDLLGDGSGSGRQSDNARRVVSAIGTNLSAVLDGFTISGGFTLNSGAVIDRSGAGMLVQNGSATIRGCVFSTNSASFGGGDLAVFDGAPVIDSCVFLGTSTAQRGLGILHTGNSSASIRACRFVGMPQTTGGMVGIGIYSDSVSGTGVLVEECEFSIRTRDFSCPAGVGIYVAQNSRFTVNRSRFINNWTCGGGGGMHVDGLGTIDRCVFAGNEGLADGGAALFSFSGSATITNSLFVGNNVGESGPGGGISTILARGAMRFINCTFASNGSTLGLRTLIVNSAVGTSFDNCIIWNNRNGGAASVTLQVASTNSPTYNNSIVQGWTGTLPGTGSFDADPMFVSATGADGVVGTVDDNLRLMPGSPGIDRGNGDALPMGLTLDLDGVHRRSNLVIDLGAYEFQCVADFDGLGAVQLQDLLAYLNAWFQGDLRADVVADGEIDVVDIFAFLNIWFAGC